MSTYDAAFAAIDEYAQQRMAVWGPPGLAIVVTDRERTLWTGAWGYANLEAKIPVTAESLFQTGSVGKSFTAFCLMQAVEAELIGLQQPLTDLVPWFDPHERIRPITLHDLLTHGSGLSSGTEFYSSGLAEAWTMKGFEPGFAPQTQFRYSNLAYKLITFALERVTGQRYPDIVAKGVFAPVGMADSYGEITHALRGTTTTGYRHQFSDRPPQAAHPWVPAQWTESATGDGTITSNTIDMAAYLRMIMNGGEAPGGRVVSPESFERMTTGYNTDPEGDHGDTYGYGLFEATIEGHRYLGHDGGMIAHETHMRADIDAGVGIVVMGSAGDVHRIGDHATDVLRDAVGGQPPRPAPTVDPRVIPGAAAYAGTWRAGEKVATVGVDGQGLSIELDGGTAMLELREEDGFLVPLAGHDLFLLRAERDTTGWVTALTHGSDRYEQAGREGFAHAADPTWAPLLGHYRSDNPWGSDLRVYERAGRLFAALPNDTDNPGEEEFELIAMSDGRNFRLGKDEWEPDRLRFEGVVQGQATIAWINNCPFGRVGTP